MNEDRKFNIINTCILVFLNILTIFILSLILFMLFSNLSTKLILMFSTLITIGWVGLKLILSESILLDLNSCLKTTITNNERLDKLVSSIADKLEINMPKMRLIQSNNINTISIGFFSSRANICITEGALKELTDDELEYILTYEMVRIKKGEMVFNTISIGTFGFILILSDTFFRSILKAIQQRGKESESLMRLLVTSILSFFGPLSMNLIYLMWPHHWEIQNDKVAIEVMESKYTAYSILEKIEQLNTMNTYNSKACANMYFVSPLIGQKNGKKYSKHLHINNRINAIKKL